MSMYAFHQYENILQTLKELKPVLQRKYPSVNYLGLFGSYVRGEERTDSDIDILIDFDFSVDTVSLFDYMNIENWLSEKLGKKVDLIQKSGLRLKIGKRILSEVIPI